MKLLLLTKRSLVTMSICLLIGIVSVGILVSNSQKAIATISEERDIPIYSVETEKKEVSISFDAAWGNEQTETLLEILDKYKIKTTFFLVGDWVDKYPESVKDIAQHGHEVENHSNTHPHMTQISLAEQKEEINKCNKKIEKITGKCPTLFRAPYGDYDNTVMTASRNCKMYCVQWSIDSIDWKNPTPAQMVERITSNIENGSIILLHNGAENTPEALPMIIEGIKSAGYDIVP
ncbi:MAG: polysaccharide deacetylase family protein, partial [Acutalibacteraceae bacterium]